VALLLVKGPVSAERSLLILVVVLLVVLAGIVGYQSTQVASLSSNLDSQNSRVSSLSAQLLGQVDLQSRVSEVGLVDVNGTLYYGTEANVTATPRVIFRGCEFSYGGMAGHSEQYDQTFLVYPFPAVSGKSVDTGAIWVSTNDCLSRAECAGFGNIYNGTADIGVGAVFGGDGLWLLLVAYSPVVVP